MQETVTFEKDLAPGVHVCINGVPAIFRGIGTDRRHYFERKTGERLETLLSRARKHMRSGETDIRIEYGEAQSREIGVEFVCGSGNRLSQWHEAIDRIRTAFETWDSPPEPYIYSEKNALRILLHFGEERSAHRLVSLRNAIVHFGHSAEPLLGADEDLIIALQSLIPQQGSAFEMVRFHIQEQRGVDFTSQSRKNVLNAWLVLRKTSSKNAQLRTLTGEIFALTANFEIKLKQGGSKRPSLIRYRRNLNASARELLGQFVTLVCIVEVHHGRERLEALDIERLWSHPNVHLTLDKHSTESDS